MCRDFETLIVEAKELFQAVSEDFMTIGLPPLQRRGMTLRTKDERSSAERCQISVRQNRFFPRAVSTDKGERTRGDWHSDVLRLSNGASLPGRYDNVCRLV